MIAIANPRNSAAPPIRGVATAWTSRSRGQATAPQRVASLRASGVSRKLPAAATQEISAYSRLGCIDDQVRGSNALLGEDRHDLAQRLDTHRTGPQQPRPLGGHVDDRRGDPDQGRATVEVPDDQLTALRP